MAGQNSVLQALQAQQHKSMSAQGSGKKPPGGKQSIYNFHLAKPPGDRKSLDAAVKMIGPSSASSVQPAKAATHYSVSPANRYQKSFKDTGNHTTVGSARGLGQSAHDTSANPPPNYLSQLINERSLPHASEALQQQQSPVYFTKNAKSKGPLSVHDRNTPSASAKTTPYRTLEGNVHKGPLSAYGKDPILCDDGSMDILEGEDSGGDTVNELSMSQAVLEEAPLPESMDRKRSANALTMTVTPKDYPKSAHVRTEQGLNSQASPHRAPGH